MKQGFSSESSKILTNLSLVWYLKGLCSFVLSLQLLNDELVSAWIIYVNNPWFLQLAFNV